MTTAQTVVNERLNSRLQLSTSQVGRVLDVHPSTVKRWCEAEDVLVRTTVGGHRRIHLHDVLELGRIRGVSTYLDPFSPYEAHVWLAVRSAEEDGDFGRVRSLAMSWLVWGSPHRVGLLVRTLGRRPGIDFAGLVDEGVKGFMRDVGEAWQEGRLRVGDEHQATHLVREALLALREEWVGPARDGKGADPSPDAPVAVVGSAEGDHHDMGSLAIRILLERDGWHVAYLGADVPLEDFAEIQRSREASLVCVSTSAAGARGTAYRVLRVLSSLYDETRPYSLALGGAELDGDPLSGGSTPFVRAAAFEGVRDFTAWAREKSLMAGPTRTLS